MTSSNITKDQLRGTRFFHLVKPEELLTIDEYAEWLESILHNSCSIYEHNGEQLLIETKQLFDRLNGLKIEIYSNEHPPPHFHVKSPTVDASFDIESCKMLEGKIDNKDLKKIQYWHKYAKQKLIKAWNLSRPTNCVVGCYINS